MAARRPPSPRRRGWPWSTVVAKLARAAGATSKVRPHGLRHTAITEALKATGGDLTKTRDFSRHKDIRTVGIYNDNRENHGLEVATGVVVGVMGETKPKGSGCVLLVFG